MSCTLVQGTACVRAVLCCWLVLVASQAGCDSRPVRGTDSAPRGDRSVYLADSAPADVVARADRLAPDLSLPADAAIPGRRGPQGVGGAGRR